VRELWFVAPLNELFLASSFIPSLNPLLLLIVYKNRVVYLARSDNTFHF